MSFWPSRVKSEIRYFIKTCLVLPREAKLTVYSYDPLSHRNKARLKAWIVSARIKIKNKFHRIFSDYHISTVLFTVKPVFNTTWEIGTTWELRPATSVARPIQHIKIDLRNKTTSELRTVFDSLLGVPNSQVPLYFISLFQTCNFLFICRCDRLVNQFSREPLYQFIQLWCIQFHIKQQKKIKSSYVLRQNTTYDLNNTLSNNLRLQHMERNVNKMQIWSIYH